MSEAKQLIPPDYMGDGVYAHDEGHGEMSLAVNHHNNKVVHIEYHTMKAIVRYWNRIQDNLKNQQNEQTKTPQSKGSD